MALTDWYSGGVVYPLITIFALAYISQLASMLSGRSSAVYTHLRPLAQMMDLWVVKVNDRFTMGTNEAKAFTGGTFKRAG